MNNFPFVSIIIPTHQRRELLLRCLTSLENQTYPIDRFEVIVVDDGSTDGTMQAINEYKKNTKMRLTYHFQEASGPGAARNAGAEKAIGSILGFLEDDVYAEKNWIDCAIKYFLSSDIACVEGKTLLEGTQESVRRFESTQRVGFLPCNMFMRRDVFISLGGFDTTYIDVRKNIFFREDADLGFRLIQKGYSFIVADDVVVRHPPLYTSIKSYFRHARRYFFDPLLYKKFPTLYREFIEVKNIGSITIHRPFHYLSFAYILTLFILLGIVLIGAETLALCGLAVPVIISSVIRLRYERKFFFPLLNPLKTFAFLILPFYYCYYFTKGCFHYRSWGAIF